MDQIDFKYEQNVAKFQVLVTHIGFASWFSGPHVGTMSDTTLFRLHQPSLGDKDFILGDLAYESVPHVLTPVKNNFGKFGMPVREGEYIRVHQFYRARVEHFFGKVNKFSIFEGYRSHDLHPLQNAFKLVCSSINLYHTVYLPYPPYRPV